MKSLSSIQRPKLHDMKVNEKERKKERGLMESPVSSSSDKYPWGLRLNLDKAALEKLGIDLPKVGTDYHVMAVASVVSVSKHDRSSADGEDHSSQTLELQIEKLGLTQKSDSKTDKGKAA
jgi:hypothetical protein